VRVNRSSGRAGSRGEDGVVALLVALMMTMLLVIAAMVLDFGVVRLDRQQARSQADAAALAGIAAGDAGTGQVYTFRAVCGALSYLKAHGPLTGLPDDFCAPASLAANMAVTCTNLATSHARYEQQVTTDETTFRVVIESPYVTTEGGWSDEALASVSADQSTTGGCDQLGVQVFESRKPGLGSLATSGDLKFGVRSAARAMIGGDDSLAPALILLERSACSALTVGSAGAGAGTFVAVKGSGGTPGSIHLDSTATGAGCGSGSNQQLIQGKQDDGVVAYGSTSPSGTPGVITSVASSNGVSDGVVSDALSKVYGTTATSGTGAVKNPVQGRDLVGRTPVDTRYRTAVRTAISQAASVWGVPTGWTVADCNPSAAQLAATRLWIECTGNAGISLNNKTIAAGEVYFNGFIKNGTVAMPNATRVYVSNTTGTGAPINAAAINLSNGSGFCVRGSCGTGGSDHCAGGAAAGRARVFVRQGSVDASGGTLRLCNTTMVLLGSNTVNGCVPPTDGAAPTSTPCTGTSGNSQVSVTGQTDVDWTAPNQYAGAIPAADRPTAWSNFEDLAMWSESAGLYKFSGGGGMSTVGVYMIPNGSPVNVGGGSSQSLTNAQYIARTFSVSGGGTLSLVTDPRNAVTIPAITGYVLVR
jgi:Flp pilus assembly protein TadG